MKNRLQNKMLEKACQDIVLEGAERAVQACPRSRQLDGDLARDACVEDGRARSCVKLHASLSNRRRCLRRGICWRCRALLVVGRRAREDLPSAQSILPQMVFLQAVGSISFPPADMDAALLPKLSLDPHRRLRHRASLLASGSALRRPPWAAWRPSSMPDAARAGRRHLLRDSGHHGQASTPRNGRAHTWMSRPAHGSQGNRPPLSAESPFTDDPCVRPTEEG